ncbi:MAG: 30S ribosomal protein S17 [Lentisphaerae bacterium]|nr:30S ribosomal protein S17 [Lentisphaerota bacterium]
MATEARNRRKERTGVVTSDAMDKTVVVQADRRIAHPLYGKVIRRSKKYTAHDEKNEAKKGDRVRITETRPLSKTKRWRLVEILARAAGNEVPS